MFRLILAIILSSAGTASAAHSYSPFTNTLNSTGQMQGLWLADSDHPGNPPIQVSNQLLDGPATINVAILHDWILNPVTHLAMNIEPQIAVYGVGGKLFKVDLRSLSPAQPFSNGTYQELCSIVGLDARPFDPSKSFVQAIVEPIGSPNTCAANVDTETWLIPVNAVATTPVIHEPNFWNVIDAFTDPIDGRFVKWIVWTGTEVDAYNANFSSHSTLLRGPPPGASPITLGRLDSTILLSATVFSPDGLTQTDNVYRVTPAGSSFVGGFSRAASSFCNFFSLGGVPDQKIGKFVFTEPTDTGYEVLTAPVSGGPAAKIYEDTSVFNCGFLAGDGPSKGHAGLTVFEGFTRNEHVLAVNEQGPATQAGILLAGDPNSTASIHYTIDGHEWINVITLNPRSSTQLVVDGDGTVIRSFPNTSITDDVIKSLAVNGHTPATQRELVYLFSPNSFFCSGGTLSEVDPVTFSSSLIDGVPFDTCSITAYGYLPTSLGGLSEPAGSSPVQIDPFSRHLYQLLGPQSDGIFTNLTQIQSFPFN